MKERRTKIVATVGPVTLDAAVFTQLVVDGIDYARINTKYGNYEQYDRIIKNVRAHEAVKNIPILFDIMTVDALPYAIKNGIKIVALSFTNNAAQLKEVRAIMPDCFLIAKIESVDGLRNFEEILGEADGIMVARGDLGAAIPLEQIPLVQKQITYQTIKQNKFLITATEMLLSITQNPSPTRAEVSDVANAVLDHSSAVMLSEETAIGKYPVEAVRFMRRIIEEAERWDREELLQSMPEVK